MTDLRSYVGASAKPGQLLDVYYTLGNAGKAQFIAVHPHQVRVKSEGELNYGIFFKGPVEVDLSIINEAEKRCKVTVIVGGGAVTDDKATYKEKGANWIEVYCTLKGVGLTLSLWRDNLYSNLRVWKGIVSLLHTWTYPLTDVLAAGEIPQLGFTMDHGTAPEVSV